MMCDCLAWHAMGTLLALLGVTFAAWPELLALPRDDVTKCPKSSRAGANRHAPEQIVTVGAEPPKPSRAGANRHAKEQIVTVASTVTASPRRRGSAERLALTGAERMRRCRAKKAARRTPVLARAGDEMPQIVTAPQASLSFSLPPIDKRKEQKQTRATTSDAGDDFAALLALWPVKAGMVKAQCAYQAARRSASAGLLLDAARVYLDGKPEWQNCLHLANWLRTESWRDPVLPLATAPREVLARERPPKPGIDWASLGDGWLATRRWPLEVGAPPDSAECCMPEGLLQSVRRKAIQQRMTG